MSVKVLSKSSMLCGKYGALCGETTKERDELFLGILINILNSNGIKRDEYEIDPIIVLDGVRQVVSAEGHYEVNNIVGLIRQHFQLSIRFDHSFSLVQFHGCMESTLDDHNLIQHCSR